MTAATMINYTVDPVWVAVKSFARSTWDFLESVGRARAAAELSRQGYHEEARNLMLRKDEA